MNKMNAFGISKRSWIYILLVGIIIACWYSLRLLGAYLFALGISDIVHENISFTDAQALTPFEICLPTYLPASVDPKPQITYVDDDGRGEIEITFDYFSVKNHNPVVQIHQRRVSENREFHPLDDERVKAEIRDVLAWQIGFDKALELLDVAVVERSLIQEKRGIVEVLEPSELKGSSVYWVNSGVLYRVFSKLSLDEAIEISNDLDSCRQS